MLSIVIPCYNEEARLSITIKALVDFFTINRNQIEVIFVNDGSTDGTFNILSKEIAPTLLKFEFICRTVNLPYNQGKGAAIKAGVLESRGEFILLCDADMSCPFENFPILAKHITDNDLVVGSRRNSLSVVDIAQPWYRILLGRIYSFLSKLLLGVPINDFTCGFKLAKGHFLRNLLKDLTVKRWAYDSEMLARAYHGGARIREVGVSWHNDSRTRVNLLSDSIVSFIALLYIATQARLGNYGGRK